jgi:hypothetical protein
MLKIKTIRDDGADRRLFEIQSDGSPAPAAEVTLVARFASHLISENDLPGQFRPGADGMLELLLPLAERTFFHDGIVFAAIDAINDPVKNPTLTRFAADLPDGGESRS